MEPATDASAESPPRTSGRGYLDLLFACGAFGLAWVFLLEHLSVVWSVSPYYHYGWLVPFLALYFMLTRWNEAGQAASLAAPRGAMAGAVTVAFLLLPAWWIRVANPDWSAIGFALAALVTGWTCFLLAWRGGWGFAGRLAFPVFFIFCAVPWPQRAENWITLSLGQWVTAATVELLQWAGVAAERAGNVVALPGGLIEVSDACSGVRSLQSMLMAGLCLGEIRRLAPRQRVMLVLLGMGLAVLLNILRNFLLAVLADARGLEAIETWHDSAGWGIFFLSVTLLFLVARWMKTTGQALEMSEPPSPPLLRRLPWQANVSFVVWFALILIGTELWYRSHEQPFAAASTLRVTWPEGRPGFRFEAISDTARDLLRASDVQAASWEETAGHRWTLTAIHWAPGETATQSARMHYPDVCLPSVGTVFIQNEPTAVIAVPGGHLSFRVSEFLSRGRKAFVFFCLREESNRDQTREDLLQDWSPWSRVQRAWAGNRNLGQQSLALAITGADDAASALRQVTDRLPELAALEAPIGTSAAARR